MNILIVGCGKVGSQLSNVLSRMGHDVAVIDQNPAHFSSLADDFSGYNVTGVPIDQDGAAASKTATRLPPSPTTTI